VEKTTPGLTGQRLTLADHQFLGQELGRLRYEPLEVADRCAAGHPRVVLGFYSPKPGGAVSATLYWLTCGRLRTAISRLEANGSIGRMERLIASDPELAQLFAADQAAYRERALAVLVRELPGRDPARLLGRVRGVAGVADPRFVKCLHAHVAFTLATGLGPIGARVLEELGFSRQSDGRWLAKACGGDGPSAPAR
jgi:hypothetical protein